MNSNIALVGYTGFVGSNIASSSQISNLYNTKNISASYDTNPDTLIYAGLRAEKYIANKYPEKDKESINIAIDNIKKINPKRVVFISTIDVYDTPVNVTEDDIPNLENLLPYGINRYFLENWIRENFNDYCILRLPGLYGKNLKKNFIYDYLNIIPYKLTEAKFHELNSCNTGLATYYSLGNDGFYQCNSLDSLQRASLIKMLDNIGFSALNFTDSRGIFQYYNLANLWKDIQICINNNIKTMNIATEPISISELYNYLCGKPFNNEITTSPPCYNFKTKYDYLFSGSSGYILNKEYVLEDIKNFVKQNQMHS